MRKLAMVALAVLCMGGTASVAAAQGGGGSMGGGRGRGNAIDRVLTQPTAITLTADQQTKVDSLKKAMTEEQSSARESAGDDRQAMMGKFQELNKKYMDAVRGLLTPEQQKTFDENVAAMPQRGRRGGGGGGGR
jgi:periplasmic protein CpxP/Spy